VLPELGRRIVGMSFEHLSQFLGMRSIASNGAPGVNPEYPELSGPTVHPLPDMRDLIGPTELAYVMADSSGVGGSPQRGGAPRPLSGDRS
jgi:hypothetical protein